MSTGLARSVQTRLVRHAKALAVDPNLILARYATERLLYRLSRSGKNEAHVNCPRTRHPEAEGRVALWLLERAKRDVHTGRYPEYTLVLSEDNAGAGASRELMARRRRNLDRIP